MRKKQAAPAEGRRYAQEGGRQHAATATAADALAAEALEQRLNQLQALYLLMAALSRASALEEIYEVALAGLRHALSIERASILLFDPDGVMRFKAWLGLSDHYRRTTEGHTPWSPDTKDPTPVLVADVDDDPTLGDLRAIIRNESIQALAFVPLVHRGSLLGKFMLYYSTPHQFTNNEIQLAQAIAGHIAIAVARRYDEEALSSARAAATMAAERAEFLAEISRVLAASLDYTQTLTSLARAMVPFLADACVIYQLVSHTTLHRLALAHVDAETEQQLREIQRFEIPLDADIPVARVVRSGTTEVEYQVAATIAEQIHPDASYQAIVRSLAPHAYICVPLTARGRTLGAVAFILTDHARHYAVSDVALAEEVGRRAAFALDNARLYQEAQDAIEVRDQFLSIAAHELKTPLTALLGNAQAIERRATRGGDLPERELRAVRIISEQTKRLSKMVAALLDISRLEQGKLTIERAPVDICALAKRVVEEVQPGLMMHTVEYISPAESSITIDGDELRLEQVLQNLIGNAVKYSLSGGLVLVQVEQRGDMACITVADRGMGIPAEDIPHLFERFYRAGNTDEQHISGMGIGLYIVKEIVSLHGGSVEVESKPGSGSTFTVYLPSDARKELSPQDQAAPPPHAADRAGI
jgi:signal transduction histidine kinase